MRALVSVLIGVVGYLVASTVLNRPELNPEGFPGVSVASFEHFYGPFAMYVVPISIACLVGCYMLERYWNSHNFDDLLFALGVGAATLIAPWFIFYMRSIELIPPFIAEVLVVVTVAASHIRVPSKRFGPLIEAVYFGPLMACSTMQVLWLYLPLNPDIDIELYVVGAVSLAASAVAVFRRVKFESNTAIRKDNKCQRLIM